MICMENGHTIEAAAAPKRLLIIDGHAYAYRAFFAIRSLSSPSGAATNAIYGFIRMFGKALERLHPSHVVVVWDGSLAEERMTLHPEYKAHRPEMPSSLRPQLDQIVSYLHASNVFSYLDEACEADDCIASIARNAAREGLEVVIASSDKDFMQLVSPQVKLLNPHDKTNALVDEEAVTRKTGVKPTQIVDWLSLIGDSVDNIPGVPGVGPKTASDLLTQFESIEELYRRLAEVRSARLRASLEAAAEVARRNQQLVRLQHQTPCDSIGMEALEIKAGDLAALRELYSGWGFKTLLAELEQGGSKTNDLFAETDGGDNEAAVTTKTVKQRHKN